jgi:hypothetical protein
MLKGINTRFGRIACTKGTDQITPFTFTLGSLITISTTSTIVQLSIDYGTNVSCGTRVSTPANGFSIILNFAQSNSIYYIYYTIYP